MWVPTENLSYAEISALCGIKLPQLKTKVQELIQTGELKPEWVMPKKLSYNAQAVLIEHYGVNTRNESQVLQILTKARQKNLRNFHYKRPQK
jgi:hypothetical protein